MVSDSHPEGYGLRPFQDKRDQIKDGCHQPWKTPVQFLQDLLDKGFHLSSPWAKGCRIP
jgi:hypothetical protein